MKKNVILLGFMILFLACGEKKVPLHQETAAGRPVESPVKTYVGTEKEDVPPEPLKPFDISSIKTEIKITSPEAHQKYLDDPLEFKEFETEEIKGETAVSGTKGTKFFPGISTIATSELGSLSSDIIIPLGTVIPILGIVQSEDSDYMGYYHWQGNLNYFYKTEWQGQEGLVFGADLYGIGQSNERNQIAAQYYQTDGIFQDFHPIIGYETITDEVQDRLMTDKLAFQKVSRNEYRLSVQQPDDMIALYQIAAKNKPQPLFITTDLLAHAQHLFFDKYLQHMEESYFYPRLVELVDGYLAKLEELEKNAITKDYPEDHKYRQSLHRAITYFQIPQAILKLAPKKIEPENMHQEVEYIAPDMDEVLAAYPTDVVQEVELILKAPGFEESPNFEYDEDYSQYKPRGHYTKNEIFGAYFRSMMWFGRLHIYISIGERIPLPFQGTPTTAMELSLKLTPVAVLMTEINKEDTGLFNAWRNLFDPITQLIGRSDDLSLLDLAYFQEQFNFESFADWVQEDDNVYTYINKAHDELPPPLISGNSVFRAPADSNEEGMPKQPMGWRLFGQRFTWDSYVHQRVSPPRFMPRDYILGLDIMKAFGSATAQKLLEQEEYGNMPGLEEVLIEIQGEFDAMSPNIWTETYYNRVLNQIKTQAQFESGSGFYFTQSPAWGIKAMLSSHGTWAALRHDTILYVKQVYGERAGGGDYEATFRTLPVPKPVHYLEPNMAFWSGSLEAIRHLEAIVKQYNLSDEVFDRRISTWVTIFETCMDITEKEYADEPVSESNQKWLSTLPSQLSKLVIPRDAGYASYSNDPDKMRGAIIADIYTNAQYEKVVEVGIGIPYRIYVPLNDGQGGKRIAIGYTFSYYEFKHPMGDRLTNEQWREWVYAEDPDLSDYEPFWTKGITLPEK